jgi:hypothetical protein
MKDFNDFDGFDEFDEFGKFNRDELNRMFRQRMSDDEFRRKFFGIIGGYQRDFERMMRLLGDQQSKRDPFRDIFSGLSSTSSFGPEDYFKNMDFTAFNEDGWDTKHWESPDGSTSYTSFSRSYYWPEEEPTWGNKVEIDDNYVLNMLEDKLSRSIEEENYEEAANIRDAIKALKEKKNDKKEEK